MSKAADRRSSIHPCKDSNGWEGWLSLGIDAATGRRVRKHVRGRTKTEVSEKIKALELARDQGGPLTGSDTTLANYREKWVAARTAVVRASTVFGYRTDLLHITRSGVGRVKLRALSAEHVERSYASVLAAGCSAGSVAHVRRTISAALNAAARRGYIARNPVPLADLPSAEDKDELEPYGAREIGVILSATHARRNGADESPARFAVASLG
ncbi:MAG: integrase [Pseudonocardiales bacterium]|nr:integrase [Pseudonocardiales bacterium]